MFRVLRVRQTIDRIFATISVCLLNQFVTDLCNCVCTWLTNILWQKIVKNRLSTSFDVYG